MSSAKNNFNHLFQSKNPYDNRSNIPSAIKSASRIPHRPMIDHGGIGFNGFNSVKKNGIGTNLFGLTPQTKRTSYIPSSVVSSARLSTASRSSVSSRYSTSKDNRPLSDQNYHRECADKIVEFLNMNGYEPQLTRQNLLRLSLSEASRIFQFLFSFFNENIIIKSGAQTSLNIVVPKQMQLLGYPYSIKNSDLTSFSGGRQLGTVLSMFESLFVLASYLQNVDANRLIGSNYFFWSEDGEIMFDNDDTVDMNKVLPRLHDLLPMLDWDIDEEKENHFKLIEQKEKHLKLLAEKLYGTQEQSKKLHDEIDELELSKQKLDQEISYLSELPNDLQKLVDDFENCQKYIEEMIEHNKANLKVKNALNEEIESNKEELIKLKAENKRLEALVDSQKHLVIEYQYAIERRKQLQEEIEQAEQENQNTKSTISTLTLEIKREHSKLESLMRDISEMISLICVMYENSKIHQFLLDESIKFHKNNEWVEFIAKFEQFKSKIDENFDETFDSLEIIMMKNLKDFRMHLIQQETTLKTQISLEVACQNQKQQKQCDQQRQEFKVLEEKFKQIWQQKNDIEIEHQNKIDELNKEIEQLKMKINDVEKLFTTNKLSTNELDEKIDNLEEEIVEKKYQIMNDYRERDKQFKQYESKLIIEIEERQKKVEQNICELKKIVAEMKKL
ncbi:kinetochore-associated Ndc80 complex subunit ndc80 [Dermatophagoides pteronyssinus]|uniref:Kinetochore-associated Ndc80 complex subunit ndc80 n=2 Tax=Dermatophagoides pteronyssinus TaxID=6956 RepID=A0ABQ8J6L7_DERPT|nr:kinetochore protein NDC80 homolog [Dermatophagoides pteronyssinus]KAH9418222.1 kinetochore-associated Ndc80 complex subunit ndc80 [Dermatophagoides pteronyssinus]